MGHWQYYRFDFSATGGTNNIPDASWEWDEGANSWRRRGVIDRPIDLSDADDNILIQIDTASTDLGQNNSTNTDINFAIAPVASASTGTFGGRFDSNASGYFHEEKTIPDGIRKSFALTNSIPSLRLRYDNNGSSSGYCTAFVSFQRRY